MQKFRFELENWIAKLFSFIVIFIIASQHIRSFVVEKTIWLVTIY